MKFTKIFAIFALIMLIAGPAMADVTSGSTAEVGSVSAMLINEAADLKDGRGFAIPGEVIFPGTPGYFGEATPGHNFIPLSKLTMFTTVWDVQSARNMLAGLDGMKDVQVRSLLATNDTLDINKIYVSIEKPTATDVQQAAFATVAASGTASISADVFAQMLVEAADIGANYVMFLAEGVNRRVMAWGVGLGLSHTNADLKGGGNGSSGVTTGGTGISYGQAGYIDKPWLQATFLRIPSLTEAPLPTIDTAEEAAVVIDKASPAEKETLVKLFREKGWFGLSAE